MRLGWFPVPNSSGGLLPFPGVSSSGVPGLLVVGAPDPLFSVDVMATSHLARPGRLATTKHVGISDVLLLVPLETFDVLGRWSACSIVGKVVGFKATVPTVDGEDDRESLART